MSRVVSANCAGLAIASTSRQSFAFWPRTPSLVVQNISARSWRTRRLSVRRWPNTLRSKHEPFGLDDATRPGNLTIIKLRLVDPHYRICSTRNVPPQQHDWWADAARDAARLDARLPMELADLVLQGVDLALHRLDLELHRLDEGPGLNRQGVPDFRG